MTMLEHPSAEPVAHDRTILVGVVASDLLLVRRITTAIGAAAPRLTPASSDDEATVLIVGEDGRKADVVERIGALRAREPAAALLVITTSESQAYCRRLLDAGAHGVVLAAELERALVTAVDAVVTGHIVQPRALIAARGHAALSNREKQVLGLVVLGFTNHHIARKLYLAESTVKSHMKSIFGKLDVRSRKEAVAAVLDPERGLGLGVLALTRSDGGEEADSP